MHTQSGAATFAACQQLFRYHPLAVTPWRSMVLRHRTAGFFVLTQLRETSTFSARGTTATDWRRRSSQGSRCRTWSAGLSRVGKSRVFAPEMRVLPLDDTTKEWHWPPITVSPLDDWRLWEYVEWHELIDAMPLLSAGPGRSGCRPQTAAAPGT
jgi:hypothetical protein